MPLVTTRCNLANEKLISILFFEIPKNYYEKIFF